MVLCAQLSASGVSERRYEQGGKHLGERAGRTVAKGLPVAACCLTWRVGAWRGSEECPGRRRPLPALLFSVIQKYCFGFS